MKYNLYFLVVSNYLTNPLMDKKTKLGEYEKIAILPELSIKNEFDFKYLKEAEIPFFIKV